MLKVKRSNATKSKIRLCAFKCLDICKVCRIVQFYRTNQVLSESSLVAIMKCSIRPTSRSIKYLIVVCVVRHTSAIHDDLLRHRVSLSK